MSQNSPVVTLPDGSQRSFDAPLTVMDVASDIGPGPAKATLAGKVNGKLVDASYVIEGDAEVAMVTERDEEGLEVIRHSTAHLLAQAVKQLFPETQVTIGPVIEDGFYYDFQTDHPFTPEDLDRIARESIENAGARPAFLNYRGFPATLCASVNEEVVHGIPGPRKLVEGDVVSIEIPPIGVLENPVATWTGD